MQKLNFSITILSKVILIQSFKLLGGDVLYFSRPWYLDSRNLFVLYSKF
jgi:hypothetical protein